jgi:hypothetical protein
VPTTPNLQLPYPTATDPADVPRDLQALAEELDGIVATIAAGRAINEATPFTGADALPGPGGYFAIPFDTVDFDTNGMFADLTTHPRHALIKVSGIYQVNGQAAISTPGNDQPAVAAIFVNGAGAAIGTQTVSANNGALVNVSDILHLTAGQTVAIGVTGPPGMAPVFGSVQNYLSLALIAPLA